MWDVALRTRSSIPRIAPKGMEDSCDRRAEKVQASVLQFLQENTSSCYFVVRETDKLALGQTSKPVGDQEDDKNVLHPRGSHI